MTHGILRRGLLRLMIPVSVCQSVIQAGRVQTAKRIDVHFGVETPGTPETVLDKGSVPHGEGEKVRCGLSQITLATCSCFESVDS